MRFIQITIDSMGAATLKHVLAYLYTGRADGMDPPELLDVLVAANMLELPRLVNIVEKVSVGLHAGWRISLFS